jgi:hypothetical protein
MSYFGGEKREHVLDEHPQFPSHPSHFACFSPSFSGEKGMIFGGATVDALSVTDSQKRSLAKTQSGGLSFEATERKFYSALERGRAGKENGLGDFG